MGDNVIDFRRPSRSDEEMRARFGDLMEFDERVSAAPVEGLLGLRVLRVAKGQLETIPRAELLPTGGVPPECPLQDVETGAELPELVYVVIRAGVSDKQAADSLAWVVHHLRRPMMPAPDIGLIDPNDDVPF